MSITCVLKTSQGSGDYNLCSFSCKSPWGQRLTRNLKKLFLNEINLCKTSGSKHSQMQCATQMPAGDQDHHLSCLDHSLFADSSELSSTSKIALTWPKAMSPSISQLSSNDLTMLELQIGLPPQFEIICHNSEGIFRSWTPCGIGWGLCCACVSVEFPLSNPAALTPLQVFLWYDFPINLLHTDSNLRVCFLGDTLWDSNLMVL